MRGMTGSRKLRPRLSLRLQEVYDTINQHPHVPDIGEVPELLTDTHAIVEFNAATCAVRESIGSFKVTIWRHGNLEPEVKVRQVLPRSRLCFIFHRMSENGSYLISGWKQWTGVQRRRRTMFRSMK